MGSKALQRSTLIQMIFSMASKGVFPISLIIIVVSSLETTIIIKLIGFQSSLE